VAVRAAAFVVALATVVLLAGLAAAAGAALGGGRLPAGSLLGAGTALAGLGLTGYGVALLAGQLTASRQAAVTLAGGCLAVLHLLNSLPRGTGQVPPPAGCHRFTGMSGPTRCWPAAAWTGQPSSPWPPSGCCW
jgi:hypothetical protein